MTFTNFIYYIIIHDYILITSYIMKTLTKAFQQFSVRVEIDCSATSSIEHSIHTIFRIFLWGYLL